MSDNIHGQYGQLNRIYPAPYTKKPNTSNNYFKVSNPIINLPNYVDLRTNAKVNIYDQGTSSSCSGNAIAAAYSIMHKIQKGSPLDISRLFVYYNARKVNGRQNIDGGAILENAFHSMKNEGCCLEQYWPFINTNVTVAPNPMCYDEALKHCTDQPNSELNPNDLLHEIKQCLAHNLPVVIGILVYTSMESSTVAKSGYIPMPNTHSEDLRGGHALCVVGYDDSRQVLIFQNSWGTVWGDQGYGYLPYAFVSDNKLTFDCHAFTQIEIDKSVIQPVPKPAPQPIPQPFPNPPLPQPNPWFNPWFPQPNPFNPWFPPQPYNPWFPPQPIPYNPPNPRPRPRPRHRNK